MEDSFLSTDTAAAQMLDFAISMLIDLGVCPYEYHAFRESEPLHALFRDAEDGPGMRNFCVMQFEQDRDGEWNESGCAVKDAVLCWKLFLSGSVLNMQGDFPEHPATKSLERVHARLHQALAQETGRG